MILHIKIILILKHDKMKKRQILFMIFFLAILTAGQAQNKSVSIGTLNPDGSAILDLESTSQGFLMTRLDSLGITTIITPAHGLIVFNSQDECYWYKKTNHWVRLCATDSLVNLFVNTNYLKADTIINNYISGHIASFDTIFNTYLISQHIKADTIINQYLTSKLIKTDSLYIGGKTIQNVIITAIDTTAWLLRGNTGTNPTSNFLGTLDNQDLVIRTDSMERLRVLKSGQVGIGTLSPLTALDIAGQITLRTGAGNGSILQSDTNGTGSWQKISNLINNTFLNNLSWGLLGNTGTNPAVNFIGTTDASDLVFKSSNQESMRLQVGGNVGIGTANPMANLHVYSSKSIFTILQVESAAGYPMLFLKADGAGANNKNFIAYADISGNMYFTVNNDAQTASANWLQMNRTGLTINTVLFPHGNIGMGTLTPLNLLDVNGAMALGAYAGTNAAPAGASLIASGNVGIGTATPGTSLDVRSSVTGDNLRIGDNSSSTSFFRIGRNTTTNNLDFTSIQGATAGFTFMSGKFGIGTTTPTELFSVCSGSLVTINTTGNMNVIAGTATAPAIGFNQNQTGFYSSGQNLLSTTVNGSNCFTIDRGNYNISLFTPVATASVISSGTSNLLFGNATIAGSGNIVLAADPSNLSSVSGNGNFVLGSHIAVTTSGNIIAGVANSIGSPDAIVMGNNNTLAGGAGNNFIIGNSNTLTGATTGNNIILGGGCNLSAVFGSAILNPNNTPLTAPANLTFYGIFPLGYRFYSNNTFTAGVEVAAGGGSWTSISDKNVKENIRELNYQDILSAFCGLPVAQWSYISQRPDPEGKYNHYLVQPKHIGVMAQDFNAAFGFGEFDNRITDSDLMGVLSASVLALNEKTQKIDDLQKQMTSLTELVNKLISQPG
jgi:hypothetical protein